MAQQKYWTVEKRMYLGQYFGKIPDIELSEKLGCSLRSVQIQAKILNLTSRSKPWTFKDEAILAQHYPSKDNQKIAKKLERTVVAVRSKASELGLRKLAKHRWTANKEEYLLECYCDHPLDELSVIFQKPEAAIREKYQQLIYKLAEKAISLAT